MSLWYAQFPLGNTWHYQNHLGGKFFRNFWMLIIWNGRRVGGMFSVGENGPPSRSNASGRFLWLQSCTTERWGNDESVSFSGKNFRIETWRNQQFHSYESRLLHIFFDYSSFPQHVFFCVRNTNTCRLCLGPPPSTLLHPSSFGPSWARVSLDAVCPSRHGLPAAACGRILPLGIAHVKSMKYHPWNVPG